MKVCMQSCWKYERVGEKDTKKPVARYESVYAKEQWNGCEGSDEEKVASGKHSHEAGVEQEDGGR